MSWYCQFLLLLVALFLSGSPVLAQHTGPDYGALPAGCKPANESATYDNARGGFTVTWTDRFNKQHTVTVKPGQTTTVRFPIPAGGSWFWFQQGEPKRQRTGFNQNVTWVEATFFKENDHARMRSVGFFAPGDQPAAGFLGELKERVTDVAAIVGAGARTIEEAMRIANAAGLAKKR